MKKNFLTVIFLTVWLFSSAQGEYLKFADLHIHPTYKHYYRPKTEEEMKFIYDNTSYDTATKIITFSETVKDRFHTDNWTNYLLDNNTKGVKALKNGTISDLRNYDQASFAELKYNPGSILCASYYPYETQFCVNGGLQRWISAKVVTKMGLKRLKYYATDNHNPLKDFCAEYFYSLVQDSVRRVRIAFPDHLYSGNGKDKDQYKEAYDYFNKIILVKNREQLLENITHNSTLCTKCDHSKDTIITSLIMTIEGAQVLYGPLCSKGKNVLNPFNINDTLIGLAIENELLENVRFLKNLPHHLFFITLAHFAQNHVSGFAKTIDRDPENFQHRLPALLSDFSFIRNNLLYKKFYGGLNLADSIGYKVVESFLNPSNSFHKKPTYIDVKHMDVKARIQYYYARRSLEKKYNIKIPIIASHFAVSGESQAMAAATGLYPIWDQYPETEDPSKYYLLKILQNNNLGLRSSYWQDVMNGAGFRPRTLTGKDKIIGLDDFEKRMYEPLFSNRHKPGISFDPFQGYQLEKDSSAGWFYPWSLNLFDEEIIEIEKSDGIIGLLLDPRQLGAFAPNYVNSYDTLGKLFEKEIKNIVQDQITPFYLSLGDLNRNEYLKCEPLLRNIFYIVSLIKQQQFYENRSAQFPAQNFDTSKCIKDPWELIALGSDYDGLIDPIDLAPTSSYLPLLHRRLIVYAYIFSQIHKNEFHDFETGRQFIKDLEESQFIMNKIFFENGKSFILKYF